MQTEKVHFTEEKETLLLALYGKALESRSADSLLRDKMADEAIKRIDYNFANTKPDHLGIISLAYRAKQLDLWTEEFLAQHPAAMVVHLGCGLDSRVYRVDPPPSVRWFDVDYPDVIELRQKLFPARPGYAMIGSPVANPALLDNVPGDRPVWVVAEGLTYYLSPSDMKTLLNGITGHFPSGQLAFDAVGSLGAKVSKRNASIQATGATIGTWWIDDPRKIKQLDPKLELVTELRAVDAYGYERLPVSLRALLRVMNLFPSLRRINRLLRYQF